MEEARINFLAQIGCGYAQWEKARIISAVIGIECQYKRSTTFGDELRIRVEITAYTRLKLSVSYSMVNSKTRETVFTGVSHHCFLNAEGRPIALSRQHPAYDEILKAHLTDPGNR